MPPRTRNCLSVLVKIQQRIHKEICCFIIVRKKMRHIKNEDVSYYKAKIIIEMREKNYWPALVFTFCATFKRAINRTKTNRRFFFFSNVFINGQAFFISGEKKIIIFSLLCKRVLGKRQYKLLSIRGFTLLIRENNYETAVT